VSQRLAFVIAAFEVRKPNKAFLKHRMSREFVIEFSQAEHAGFPRS
jgi:hypothetical protein